MIGSGSHIANYSEILSSRIHYKVSSIPTRSSAKVLKLATKELLLNFGLELKSLLKNFC